MLSFNELYFKVDYDRPDVQRRCTIVTVLEDKREILGEKPKLEELKVVCKGIAMCHPKDNFNKVQGRKIAIAAALKLLGWDKETRTEFWKAYFASGNRMK